MNHFKASGEIIEWSTEIRKRINSLVIILYFDLNCMVLSV